MKNKFRVIITMLVILAVTGCATNETNMPNLGINKAKITLNPGEFRVVRIVRGEASSSYLLWIVDPTSLPSMSKIPMPLIDFQLGGSDLHERAMQDLNSKHDLRGKPQILHNLLEEWTLANYLGLFAILKVSITAEVIEFTEKSEL